MRPVIHGKLEPQSSVLPGAFQTVSSRQQSPGATISAGGSQLGGPPWMVDGSSDLTQQL